MFLKICRNYLFVLGIVAFIFFIIPDVFGQEKFDNYKQGNDTCDMDHSVKSQSNISALINKQQAIHLIKAIDTDKDGCVPVAIKTLANIVLEPENGEKVYIGKMHLNTLGINTRSVIMLFNRVTVKEKSIYRLRGLIEFNDEGRVRLFWGRTCK